MNVRPLRPVQSNGGAAAFNRCRCDKRYVLYVLYVSNPDFKKIDAKFFASGNAIVASGQVSNPETAITICAGSKFCPSFTYANNLDVWNGGATGIKNSALDAGSLGGKAQGSEQKEADGGQAFHTQSPL